MILRVLNKRGQIAKLIISFPMILIIFVVIGLSLVISIAAANIKGGGDVSVASSVSVITDEDLMPKEIEFNFAKEASGVQRMNVLEAIRNYYNDIKKVAAPENKNIIGKALQNLLNENGTCLFIYSSEYSFSSGGVRNGALDYFIIRDDKGKISYLTSYGQAENLLNVYSVARDNPKQLSFDAVINGVKKRIYVDYYYGRCAE